MAPARAAICRARPRRRGAQTLWEDSLALRRALDDRAGIAATLSNLGMGAANQGQFDIAAHRFAESVALLRELGNRGGLVHALGNLSVVYSEQEAYGPA